MTSSVVLDVNKLGLASWGCRLTDLGPEINVCRGKKLVVKKIWVWKKKMSEKKLVRKSFWSEKKFGVKFFF